MTRSGTPWREEKSAPAARMAAASRTSQAYVSTGVESEDFNRSRNSPRRATRPSVSPRAAYNRASASPMPLEAPVRKTFIASSALVLAGDAHELVDDREHLVGAAGLLGGGVVLAVHHQARDAVDLVRLRELLRARDLGRHGEGLLDLGVFRDVDAVLRQPL